MLGIVLSWKAIRTELETLAFFSLKQDLYLTKSLGTKLTEYVVQMFKKP